MLVIQYKLVWNGDDRVDWTDVGQVDIPSDGGAASIKMPLYGQSDRLKNSSGFGANAEVECYYRGQFSRVSGNRLHIVGGQFDTFRFVYNSSMWGSHIGEPVVKGQYMFAAYDDQGNRIGTFYYDGWDTVVADYTIDDSMGTYATAAYNIDIGPQEISQQFKYGECKNYVNQNLLEVYVRFKNTYPADYRPGAIIGSNWQSHDRSGGESHILGADGKWIEMRTVDGGSSKGDTPSIIKDGKWVNQRKLGKE